MYTFLPPRFIQALIHFEAIQSTAKRIDYLDSLVEKVIVPNTEKATVVSASTREELSSIFFEVHYETSVCIFLLLVFVSLLDGIVCLGLSKLKHLRFGFYFFT